ncbi:hypothetical protein E4U58_006952 [Claviceps cyperi]|nr:hypothetical protein E4U58_006952 [Claviceps cyperi]
MSRKCLNLAPTVAKFIKDKLWSPWTRILRRLSENSRNGDRGTVETTTKGFADDYAISH